MQKLSRMYFPITGTPMQRDATYREYAPCDALKPYIRCFWGTEKPVKPAVPVFTTGLVIPDTCMDVIFDVNYSANTYSSVFCGLDETTEITHGRITPDRTATFGIRFFAWSAVLFSDGDMKGTCNQRGEAASFSKAVERALEPYLFDAETMQEKMKIAEKILLRCLQKDRMKSDVLNSVYRMLETKGRENVKDLSVYTGTSLRTLERGFQEMMGVSPKTFATLMRYQLLWQEIAFSASFDVMDAVDKYGYADQAHLLHDFKHRHGMTPAAALRFAKEHR